MSGVNSSSVGRSKSKHGAHGSQTAPFVRNFLAFLFLLFVAAAAAFAQSASSIVPGPKPADASPERKELVGIYSGEKDAKHSYILLEQEGKLFWRDDKGVNKEFVIDGENVFPPSEGSMVAAHTIVRDEAGHIIAFAYLNFGCRRVDPGSDSSQSYRVKPQRPVEELRREALAATPPNENRSFRKPDLVELAKLDPAIRLDIRYATTNDFLGVPVYTQARAYLQRPAAEALVRVLHKLQPFGYSLLIHDGYRPWYVTKIFWDATPAEGKIFVADPAQGSRHNRGCAVDLTLYDLKTDQPVEMTGMYDEMSPRSFPNFPGGTSLQRWHRDLLRRAMESEGFTVYDSEWWHFDYKDWHEYGILNIPFEKLGIGSPAK
ncbi:MAG TPA: M15 family metallopeptidase [Candidatus Dormibacteraeota bacterium]|jgi:D-alanyl-D-alanine dipeptidase|nr:M15 family metallopeptidase [Candidatus Dormibacteraeota bacterium]